MTDTTIPDDIMKAARECAVYMGSDSIRNDAHSIAVSILAERERCAEKVEDLLDKDGFPLGQAVKIANAIRRGEA